MTNVSTNAALLEAMRQAASRPLTANEVKAQRISFILSSLSDKSTVTRDQVVKIIDEQAGVTSAK